MKSFVTMLLLLLLPHGLTRANTEQAKHSFIRRLVVFPLLVPDSPEKESEDAWWKIREELTKSRRFFIASRNFMIKKDVFQPRGALVPADCIILGRLLDAQALIVTYLDKRTLTMTVYEGTEGLTLWTQSVDLHQGLPIGPQIVASSMNLIRDFIASFPYQGFHILAPLKTTPLYRDKDNDYGHIYVGVNSKIQVNDKCEWIELKRSNFDPLFQGGSEVRVAAEGIVTEVFEESVVVRLDKIQPEHQIQELDLVRFPNEFRRVQDELAIKDDLAKRAHSHWVSMNLDPNQKAPDEKRALITSGAFLGSLAAFLLLAF